MATNVVVYDLENYPDNNKTIVTDQKLVTPIGYEGDEQWVSSFVTTAYSDIDERTAIQDLYIQEIKGGWLKSSGFVSAGFTLGSNNKRLKIKLDASAGAAGGGGYYTITLEVGTGLTGEAVAEDMETKIRAISLVAGDSGFSLAYMNASVEYIGGRFWIISGMMSAYYTGTNRSSVDVVQSGSDICWQTLGFNLSINSETIASVSIKEVELSAPYNTNTTSLSVDTGLSVSVGDCFMITDDQGQKDYFTAISGSGETSIVVCTHDDNSYVGIDHSYTVSGTKVQKLREQDPEQVPVAYYNTIDKAVRFGIKSIANQIDFTA